MVALFETLHTGERLWVINVHLLSGRAFYHTQPGPYSDMRPPGNLGLGIRKEQVEVIAQFVKTIQDVETKDVRIVVAGDFSEYYTAHPVFQSLLERQLQDAAYVTNMNPAERYTATFQRLSWQPDYIFVSGELLEGLHTITFTSTPGRLSFVTIALVIMTRSKPGSKFATGMQNKVAQAPDSQRGMGVAQALDTFRKLVVGAHANAAGKKTRELQSSTKWLRLQTTSGN